MPYCKECGRELESDAKFCTYCGTPVSAKAPPKTIKRAKARPEAPQTTEKKVIATMASIVIGIVIVAAVVAYIATESGEEGGGETGLVWSDIKVIAGDDSTSMTEINHGLTGPAASSFTVMAENIDGFVTLWINGREVATTIPAPSDHVITLHIIHKPSGQKMFSSTTVGVD